jgi:hypothetical protein
MLYAYASVTAWLLKPRLKPRGSLCVDHGYHFLNCLHVVWSVTQIRAPKRSTTVDHFDNAPASRSLATETDIFTCLWCILCCHPTCHSVKTHGRPGYHHMVFKMFIIYVHDNISCHVHRYGGYSSTFSPFTKSADLLYILPAFNESFV